MIKKEFMNWLVDCAEGFGIGRQYIGDVLLLKNQYDYYAVRMENVEKSILFPVLISRAIEGINKHHEVFEIYTYRTHVEINGFGLYLYGHDEECETITDAYWEVLNFVYHNDMNHKKGELN